jgi:hypothetical protein
VIDEVELVNLPNAQEVISFIKQETQYQLDLNTFRFRFNKADIKKLSDLWVDILDSREG